MKRKRAFVIDGGNLLQNTFVLNNCAMQHSQHLPLILGKQLICCIDHSFLLGCNISQSGICSLYIKVVIFQICVPYAVLNAYKQSGSVSGCTDLS